MHTDNSTTCGSGGNFHNLICVLGSGQHEEESEDRDFEYTRLRS